MEVVYSDSDITIIDNFLNEETLAKVREQSECLKMNKLVLGDDKVLALSDRQDAALGRSLKRLLERKPAEEVTDEEIVGQYELVVYHLSPLVYEVRKGV